MGSLGIIASLPFWRRASLVMWLLAFAAEAAFTIALLDNSALAAIYARAVCAGAAGLAASGGLAKEDRPARTTLLGVSAIVLAMPWFGLFIMVTVLAPVLLRAHGINSPRVQTHSANSFEPDHFERALLDVPSGPAIQGFAEKTVEARMRAIAALKLVDDHKATPLLRAALGDPAEEVRLLAYAVLEKKEREAQKRKAARAEEST
jgi:hypothetical protein